MIGWEPFFGSKVLKVAQDKVCRPPHSIGLKISTWNAEFTQFTLSCLDNTFAIHAIICGCTALAGDEWRWGGWGAAAKRNGSHWLVPVLHLHTMQDEKLLRRPTLLFLLSQWIMPSPPVADEILFSAKILSEGTNVIFGEHYVLARWGQRAPTYLCRSTPTRQL